jgi:hypothetical protein
VPSAKAGDKGKPGKLAAAAPASGEQTGCCTKQDDVRLKVTVETFKHA